MSKPNPRSLATAVIIPGLLLLSSMASAAWLNDRAPDFSLRDITGKTVTLESLKGRVLFINFWASWCPPCKKETPELDKLAGKYKDTDLTVLAVNIDKTKDKADDFLERIGLLNSNHFTILLDPQSSVVSSYGARAMPTSFIVDRNGTIRYVHLGFNESDPSRWTNEVESLVK